eukprot:3780584-Pyramimonas_sp.AAC.1
MARLHAGANEGDPVVAPDHLLGWRLQGGAEARQACQLEAQKWRDDRAAPTRFTTAPALPSDDSPASVATPATESTTPTRSTAASSRTWILD